MKSRLVAAALIVAALGLSAGCSSSSDPEVATTVDSESSAATATSQSGSPQSGAPESESVQAGLVIEVRIDGGSVSPLNDRFDAVVGEPVTLRVDSDTEDELHVHSVPDHSFEVAAEAGQEFEFTVDVPGTVAVELHGSGRTVATLLVRP